MNDKELLEEYKNTGLTPEQIKELEMDWSAMNVVLNEYKLLGTLDHLRELTKAYKEGRCIMLSELKENDNLPETEVIATNNIKYSYGYGSYLIGYIVKDEESKTGHSCENDFSILMNITHWGKLPKITKEKLE